MILITIFLAAMELQVIKMGACNPCMGMGTLMTGKPHPVQSSQAVMCHTHARPILAVSRNKLLVSLDRTDKQKGMALQ